MSTAHEILTRKLAEAETRVAVIRQLIAELDLADSAESPRPPTQPRQAIKTPPQDKRRVQAPNRSDLPAVGAALKDGPLRWMELRKSTGFSPARLRSLMHAFGPEANGSAYFAKREDGWALTELGRKELSPGEAQARLPAPAAG